MKLVWHSELGEDTWLRLILAGVVTEEVRDPDFRYFADDCIHVINNNLAPLASRTDYFARCRRDARNVMLLQASDEWFSGGYQNYRFFDKVVRNYASWLVRGPGIVTVPLGFPNHLIRPAKIKRASARAYLWSFVGGVKLSRHEMAKALVDLTPSRLVDSSQGHAITDAEFRALVSDSVFAPCPMGNATNDTWRLYEALEFGCVPVVEHRATLDYLTELLGSNPIPSFGNWRKARDYLAQVSADPAAMDALQHRVTSWWEGKKAALAVELAAFLTGPSDNVALTAFAGKMRNRMPPVHEALRLAELTRHQTPRSMVHRLKTPRRILARVARESL